MTNWSLLIVAHVDNECWEKLKNVTQAVTVTKEHVEKKIVNRTKKLKYERKKRKILT